MMKSQMRANRSLRGPSRAEHEVLVRDEAMDREKSRRRPRARRARRARRRGCVGGDLVRLGERRQQQREERRGEHDARGGAEHAVLRAIAGLAQHQDAERAHAGAEAGEQAADECRARKRREVRIMGARS